MRCSFGSVFTTDPAVFIRKPAKRFLFQAIFSVIITMKSSTRLLSFTPSLSLTTHNICLLNDFILLNTIVATVPVFTFRKEKLKLRKGC